MSTGKYNDIIVCSDWLNMPHSPIQYVLSRLFSASLMFVNFSAVLTMKQRSLRFDYVVEMD